MSEKTETIGGGFRWDPTISAGALVAMIPIVLSVAGAGSVAFNRLGELEVTMLRQGESFDRRLKAVEDSLVLLRVDAARRDGMEKMISDHESRLRVIEGGR